MQNPQQIVVPNEILSAGVDWITATAKTGGSRPQMDELATHCFTRALDAGEETRAAKVQGYVGYSTNHIFYGERKGGVMMRVSSDAARDLWRSVSEVADNVSRLDLQVTVWTPNEQPHVARVIHEQIKRGEHGQVSIRNSSYIEGHPDGQTVILNKRCSSVSARVYDKAAESRLGNARSVWRYEIECRARSVSPYLAALRRDHTPSKTAALLVHQWFRQRGITTIFAPPADSSTLDMSLSSPERNTLQWFRDSLSKTIRRQITLHGREAVIQALGLDDSTNPN